MKKTLIAFTLLLSFLTHSQTIKEKSINATIGFGISAPFENYDITGTGFYFQGEYVLDLASWIDVRPYAGVVLTKRTTDNDLQNNPLYEVTSNAFLIGGKTRIKAPIPWISPYIEIGVGASIGSFKTFTPSMDIEKKGVLFHVPFSIGLELGKEHNFDIAFTYYFHSAAEQFSGAFAIGLSIPLNNNSK